MSSRDRLTDAELARIHSQERDASHSPVYLGAVTNAIADAVLKPDVEVRIWFDQLGEMTLALATIATIFRDQPVRGVTLLRWDRNRDALTETAELSNGSAVLLGLKRFEHVTARQDHDRALRPGHRTGSR